MSLFNILGCKAENKNDPYWEFIKDDHFRPELNKGDYYKLTGFDFGWFVLQPISKFVKEREFEIERGKSLSYGQKALYYWWYLDAQVNNGGFVQFYYNGYGPYVPSIIKGLEHIGDMNMANLVKKADNIYQKNKKLVGKAQKKNVLGRDLYDRLDKLSVLDDIYYDMSGNTMSLIEAYIRKNPNEICLDEKGEEFNLSFTGLCQTFYSNKTVKEEFHLEQGVITGIFKSYYENGKPKERIAYDKGKQTGERKEFYEDEILKYQVTKEPTKNILIHEWFYENGNPKKLESKNIDKQERVGEYKEWYENGQLDKTGTYKSKYERDGEWLEFYENGGKKVEAEFVNGEYRLKNHWSKAGEQTLINGTGLYVNEYSSFGDKVNRIEEEYKNQEMENGVNHGVSRNYYNNGNLKEETVYENGRSISTKQFSKFKNPRVKTTITSKLPKNHYDRDENLVFPDNDPKLLNLSNLEKNITAKISQIKPYGDDHSLNYSYRVYVNKEGDVDDVKLWAADNGAMREEIEKNLFRMKFEIALKDNIPIRSMHFVRHQFHLIE